MKNILPLLILVLCVLACGKFGSSPNTTSNTNTTTTASPTQSPTPAPHVKIVDIPGLVGKSRDEVKKILSAKPTSENPWLEWSFPQGDLTIEYAKDKPSKISFSFKPMAVSALDSAEKVGAMVGIDLKGETPKSTNPSFDTYEQVIQGKPVDVVFHKIRDDFVSVAIELD